MLFRSDVDQLVNATRKLFALVDEEPSKIEKTEEKKKEGAA